MKNLFTVLALISFGLSYSQNEVVKNDTVCEVKKVTYKKVVMLTGSFEKETTKQIKGYLKKKEEDNPFGVTYNYFSSGVRTTSSEDFYDLNFKKLPKDIIVWFYKEIE